MIIGGISSLRYAKNREQEKQIKTAEFRSAKKVEEEALMAALGMKSMPPPSEFHQSLNRNPFSPLFASCTSTCQSTKAGD